MSKHVIDLNAPDEERWGQLGPGYYDMNVDGLGITSEYRDEQGCWQDRDYFIYTFMPLMLTVLKEKDLFPEYTDKCDGIVCLCNHECHAKRRRTENTFAFYKLWRQCANRKECDNYKVMLYHNVHGDIFNTLPQQLNESVWFCDQCKRTSV